MKFTEGYWLRSERANAAHAMQAYIIEALPDRLRVVAPLRHIAGRDDTLNVGTITTEFTSVNEHTIGVRSWHYEGYRSSEPRFPLHTAPCPVHIEETADEAVMTAGKVTVRVNKREWGYTFESGGRALTGCGFRGLGYMQYDRPISTMSPQQNYLADDRCHPYLVTELSLQAGECVYGLGERFTSFVKNGQVVDMWNEDGGTSSQIAYKNVPLYLTNRGYGVFVEHTGDVSFEVASEKVSRVGFSVRGEELRYNLVCGETPKEVLQHYTALTGRPPLPPAWSFGLWLSTSFTTNYDEATTSAFIEGMAERDLPLSVFHYDCFWMRGLRWCDFEWDNETFPDVEGMLRRAKDRGLKICVWVNPYIAQGTAAFREGLEHGYLLLRADGRGVKQLDHWQPGMALVDFTNPDAAAWYQDKLRALLHSGVDCFKTDFGERIPIDVAYHNGSDPVGMHNYYAYLYNRCVFELLQQERGQHEAVLFARSATAGCQQFPVHWGGDNTANYPSMAETLRGGLSFAMSGFSFWSHDIGGFEATAAPDLYKRWVQFGMLSTHSRLHGSKSYRVPWNFDEEAVDVLRFFTKLKCRLMPYLYGEAAHASRTGIPVMRPMAMEFCGPDTAYLDMQYMLGERLLVAPVFREDGVADYYLPGGTWTHLLSGERRQGGCWYRDQYGYLSLPLYVRENTLLAIGANDSRPDYGYADGVELHLFSLQEGATAHCTIPDLHGSPVCKATARRSGGAIDVNLSGHCGNCCLVLRGIEGIAQLQGGDARAGAQGMIVHPSKGSTELHITVLQP